MPYKDKKKEKERGVNRRKTEEYKAYQREYQKKWRERNKDGWKKIRRKSEERPERKKYLKEWQRNSPKFKEIRRRFYESKKSKEYQKKWAEEHRDKISEKGKKYNKTEKGILNKIKKVQNRRIKFKKISGVYYNLPTKNLITMVNNRDKRCIYCDCEFSEYHTSIQYGTYDHLNAFKPHSKTNTVRCCSFCNSSKGEKDVLKWLESKKLKPSIVVIRLLEFN